ncbi:hypothetical protein BDZ94DRAFT_346634 [Collybia nuda]|uniref:Uncharacterized protein n=1 Tax=Collybia nuda TaxID=64659 RepID=A0A9P5YB70_9AGAR|nr:hypothetical protein BDZ94DRAFT_346634 [Collybia nuda]
MWYDAPQIASASGLEENLLQFPTMKLSSTLTSLILASCGCVRVQGSKVIPNLFIYYLPVGDRMANALASAFHSQDASFAQYCVTNPLICADLDPVPTGQCTKLHHQGVVGYFVTNVDCVLFREVGCTGESKALVRGELGRPDFFAGSFMCSPT